MSGEDVKQPPSGGTEEVSVNAAPKKAPMTNSQRQAKYAKNRKEAKLAKAYVYDSATEPTKLEAKRLLELRGLKNNHVIDTVYKLLLQEAEAHDIPANRFLFTNGIVQTLRSYDEKEAQPLAEIPAEPVVGELLNRAELYALYDASIATHEAISFEEFLNIRLNGKKDCYNLGKNVLEKDFAACHREWTDFFPKFDPTGLRSGYTQREAIQWLEQLKFGG